jgi:low affinity Fe/Cu permease
MILERKNHPFEKLSNIATRATGTPLAFLIAFTVIIAWAISGPLFHYSDTWQLVINTSTTVITFLMVFLIQQSQNKETTAIQLKLNELIAANKITSNRLIDIEDLSDEELNELKKFYSNLAQLAKNELNIFSSHSLDEAKKKHSSKMKVNANAIPPME